MIAAGVDAAYAPRWPPVVSVATTAGFASPKAVMRTLLVAAAGVAGGNAGARESLLT